MPPRRNPPPAAPAAPSRRPAAATNAAAAADELSNAMAAMNAPSYQVYDFTVRHPFMIKTTPFIEGSKVAIVDLYVYSLHQEMYRVSLDASGTKLSIVTVVPPMFSDPNRLAQEYALEGDRDALLTSHVETTNVIRRDHPNGVHYSPPQVITLPFACEQEFQKGMVWNEGNHQLYAFFVATGTPCPHQYSPVLRVTLRSVQKAITEEWNQPTITQGCLTPPGGRAPPGVGGGGGGGGGGAGGGVPQAVPGGGGMPGGGGGGPGAQAHPGGPPPAHARAADVGGEAAAAAAAAANVPLPGGLLAQQAMAAQRAAARAEHRNRMAQEGLRRAVPV